MLRYKETSEIINPYSLTIVKQNEKLIKINGLNKNNLLELKKSIILGKEIIKMQYRATLKTTPPQIEMYWISKSL